MNKIEILAPAGNIECAEAAIAAGADAIYLGLTTFSARDSAQNFALDELEKLCTNAHILGVKVYVALNTVVKQAEVEAFVKNAVDAYNAGADALIMQDVYLGSLIKKQYPQITLHLSTQAGACNRYGALLAKEMGFTRVIAARETPLADLREMAQVLECEAFVQGALCTCFSGQCYFSSFVGGNSGNRGRCKQPCRKKYAYNRKGYDTLAYRLSPSDLCVGENVEKFAQAGVCSLKIEGRLRRPEYVSAAVTYYKKLLNGIADLTDKSNLKRAYNRGNYTKGLAFGQDKTFLSSAVQGHIGEFVGNVFVENGKYVCKSNLACRAGDGFKILRGGEEVGGAVFDKPTRGGFTLATKCRLKNGDKAFLTTDSALCERLFTQMPKKDCKVKVFLAPNQPATVQIDGVVYQGEPFGEALNRPLSENDIARCFNKTDNYPFSPQINAQITGNLFATAAQLNALRRGAYATYYQSFQRQNKLNFLPLHYQIQTGKNAIRAVICGNLCGILAQIGILKPNDYTAISPESYQSFQGEKYIYLPAFLTGEELAVVEKILPDFDGVYAEGYFGAYLAKKHKKSLFVGTGFNVTNAATLSQISAKYVALSKELTKAEAEQIADSRCFYLTAGDIKLMDFIYCPFEKTCANCDKKDVYTLTDDNDRQFFVRRYRTSACRFELFNCASLVCENDFCNALYDCTLSSAQAVLAAKDEQSLKAVFKKITRGHAQQPIL